MTRKVGFPVPASVLDSTIWLFLVTFIKTEERRFAEFARKIWLLNRSEKKKKKNDNPGHENPTSRKIIYEKKKKILTPTLQENNQNNLREQHSHWLSKLHKMYKMKQEKRAKDGSEAKHMLPCCGPHHCNESQLYENVRVKQKQIKRVKAFVQLFLTQTF